MFEDAYQLTLKQSSQVKQLTDDIFSQLILDIKVLPRGRSQEALFNLVNMMNK